MLARLAPASLGLCGHSFSIHLLRSRPAASHRQQESSASRRLSPPSPAAFGPCSRSRAVRGSRPQPALRPVLPLRGTEGSVSIRMATRARVSDVATKEGTCLVSGTLGEGPAGPRWPRCRSAD